MTFENPLAWWLAALAVPIVALHLHFRRRRVVEVSSLLLWRGVIADRAGRGRMRNVRDGVALAFLLAALAAFTVAAVGPVTGAPASDARRLAIVVDASATMNARPVVGEGFGESRFHQAMNRAIDAERKLAPQDELCVWAAGETPHVIVEPRRTDGSAVGHAWVTVHGKGARLPDRDLETLAPSTLATTVRLAARAAPGLAKRPATVLVLTDEIGAETLKDLPPGDVDVRVGVVDAGRPVKNAGIVACDLDPADASRVLVRVATTDGPPAEREVVLRRDGGEISRAPLAFDADGVATAMLALGAVADGGGLVEVALAPADDFAADDSAILALPATKPLAVAVVAETPSPFLVQALRAMPDVADPARTALVRPGSPASDFDAIDVVIADGAPAPAGKPVLVFGGAGSVLERPLLWGVGKHAVLAGVDLSPLRIASATRVDPAPGDVTVIASAAGLVGVAGERGGVRRVVFGFRPDASTLPLEAAFPILVRNSLRWLAHPPETPRYAVAGEPAPDGDGAVVPYPRSGLQSVRLRSGAEVPIRWVAPRGFRLAPTSPVAAKSAGDVVAALADRHGDADTRQRLGPRLAAIGAALLAAGAILLRRPRPGSSTAAPPSTGSAWATSSPREEPTRAS